VDTVESSTSQTAAYYGESFNPCSYFNIPSFALKKLHNVDLRDFYSSTSIIRIINSWTMRGGGLARMVVKSTSCRLLIGMPKGKRLL
jgi:hypothetical protein